MIEVDPELRSRPHLYLNGVELSVEGGLKCAVDGYTATLEIPIMPVEVGLSRVKALRAWRDEYGEEWLDFKIMPMHFGEIDGIITEPYGRKIR